MLKKLLIIFPIILVLFAYNPKPASSQTSSFIFTAHGDLGEYNKSEFVGSLNAVAASNPAFSIALGDMNYESVGDEQRWCQTIQNKLGSTYPFQIVMGNHEDQSKINGYIGNFVQHCPDRLNSSGIYGAEYYFDYPKTGTALVRTIMIGAGNDWDYNGDGSVSTYERFDYNSSSGNAAHLSWLGNAIDSARSAGIPWIVVGMHKNCLTMGNKPCEIGTELLNFLVDKKVDFILQGHDHDYQRSKQLAHSSGCSSIPTNTVNQNCIVDDGADNIYTKGAGTIIMIQGDFGGGGFTSVISSDSEAGYFAKAMGGDGWYDLNVSSSKNSGSSRGFSKFTVSADQISVEHVKTSNPGIGFNENFIVTGSGATVPPSTATPTSSATPVASQAPTPSPSSGPTLPPSGFQPTAPYYSTFYYMWYKTQSTDGNWSYWNDHGNSPPSTWFSHFLPDPKPDVFDPATELYSANDYNNFKWQVEQMARAKLEVSIASWWGQGTKEDVAFNNIINNFMSRSDNPYPNLRWSIYYEDEGFADPDVPTLVSDLNHIKNNFAQSPYYLKVNGKPVIFVYAGVNDSPGTMTSRWKQANQQIGNYFYVVLKVFSGFASDANQPDSWHQYAPATRSGSNSPYYSYVSPGFWLDDGSAVRLERNLSAFDSAVGDMVNSNTTWKMIQTWNEWGEGTSVEPGEQIRINTSNNHEEIDPTAPAFKDAYVQVLANRLPALEAGRGGNQTNTPGDANNDGFVDGLDYVIWLNHYNSQTSNGSTDGDFNSDGKVDGLDYVIWLTNY